MTIQIEQTVNGYNVRFPKHRALLDNFKATFKSARFDRDLICWQVGPKSGKRLSQWAALAESLASDIEAMESDELNAQELASLESEINAIRAETAKARQAAQRFEYTQAALTASREALAKATADLSIAKADAIAKGQMARKTLETVIDLNAVITAQHTMKVQHGKVGSAARDAFNDAKEVIRQQCDRLLNAGFRSAGLAILADCNFNRPERDNPSTITLSDMCNLTKASNDERD